MAYSKQQLWQRFQKYYTKLPALGLALDLSRMNFPDDFFAAMEETVVSIKAFASEIHKGKIAGAKGPFKNLLHIGIWGSAPGPRFVSQALGQPGKDKLSVYFFDNTDPDDFDNVLSAIGGELDQTLCVVVSKSGGTKETRNGMLEAAAAYNAAGLNFGRHAVAITSRDSELDKYAVQNSWLMRFPMWDWVGGRTSELSAVGLLSAALQGLDIDLRGTRDALYENGRESHSIIVTAVDSFGIGMLIALFERTVGFYASLINVHEYHQPGVEAGKKAAAAVINLQRKVTDLLGARAPAAMSAQEIADAIQGGDEAETVFRVCPFMGDTISPDSPRPSLLIRAGWGFASWVRSPS